MSPKKFKSLDKMSPGDLVLGLELQLDSMQQILQRNKTINSRKQRILWRKAKLCLGMARRLMKIHPQIHYTLTRCTNPDELPYIKHKGEKRASVRTDWHAHKRQLLEKKQQSKLENPSS